MHTSSRLMRSIPILLALALLLTSPGLQAQAPAARGS